MYLDCRAGITKWQNLLRATKVKIFWNVMTIQIKKGHGTQNENAFTAWQIFITEILYQCVVKMKMVER